MMMPPTRRRSGCHRVLGRRVLFYLEAPAAAVRAHLAKGIATACGTQDARVMVEKPFGHDLASSRQLNDDDQYFGEDADLPVDDWLAFDPVENVLLFRSNSVIEPPPNRTYVESIQITMAEAFDVAAAGSTT